MIYFMICGMSFIAFLVAFMCYLIQHNKSTADEKNAMRKLLLIFIVCTILISTYSLILKGEASTLYSIYCIERTCLAGVVFAEYVGVAYFLLGFGLKNASVRSFLVQQPVLNKERQKNQKARNSKFSVQWSTSKFVKILIPSCALLYMIGFFGIIETYYVNINEFQFTVDNIVIPALVILLIGGIAAALLSLLMRETLCERISLLLTGCLVMAYVQNGFLNYDHFINGSNSMVPAWIVVTTTWLWLVVLVVPELLYKRWRALGSYAMYLAGFLLLIQLVPVPILITSCKTPIQKTGTTEMFDGTEQFHVASKKNVVLFVMDSFGAEYFDELLEQDSDYCAELKDFTYYNNVNTHSFATAFSMPYLLTAGDPDFTMGLDESNAKAWNSDNANYFYGTMRENGYKIKLYSATQKTVGGAAMGTHIDNLKTVTYEKKTQMWRTYRICLHLSLYKYMPYALKDFYYVADSYQMNRYTKNMVGGAEIVSSEELLGLMDNASLLGVSYYNHDFYRNLCEGLTVDDQENEMNIQILNGMHTPLYGLDGETKVSTAEELDICMSIVTEYIRQLKELGLYDDTCIILTADHGTPSLHYSNPVMLVKGFHESKDQLTISSVPGCVQTDLLPTILDLMGENPEELTGGESLLRIDDVNRLRFVREYNVYQELPEVKRIEGYGTSSINGYKLYEYQGETKDISEEDLKGIYPIYNYWW